MLIIRYFKVQNIPEVLLQYRRHEGQISSAKYAEQQRFADMIRIRQLIENLGFKTSEIPASLHLQLMKKEPIEPGKKTEVAEWIETIVEKNSVHRYYDEKRLRTFLGSLSDICFSIC